MMRKIIRLFDRNILGTLHYFRFRSRFTLYRHASLRLHRDALFDGPGHLSVGVKWPAYGPRSTRISVWPGGNLIVNGNFRVYSGCQVIVDENARLEIGSGYINSNSSITCFNHIRIGNDVMIAEGVTIRDSDNHSIQGARHKDAPIAIGDHVWIGLNAIILKGVTIGDGSIVAAGSVVTRNVPPRCLVAGVPARVIREDVSWN